jgi:serine protease Do
MTRTRSGSSRRSRTTAALAGAAAFVALTAAGVQFTPSFFGSAHAAAAVPQRFSSPIPLDASGQPFSFASLVERVSPAVVSVSVDREQTLAAAPQMPAPFREFFRDMPGQNGAPQMRRSRSAGAGFIIEPNGYVVTNNHVVENARRVTVSLSDGREFQARVVGADPDTDVALLKIDGAPNLPTVAFGDDRRLRVGDWVVAVGNPYGLGGTVTAGIVSSLGRDIGTGPYTDYIQIDAPINQGNSGGPTFDLSGRVVGMNTAIFSPSGGSVGIGFAIPASSIQVVVDQLKATGTVQRGWLGVSIQDLTPDMASSLGLRGATGAIVAEVVDNSPASRAGFRQGDVVLALNGNTLSDSRDLTRRVAALRPGERASFTVHRDGARHTLTAAIEKRDTQRIAGVNAPGGDGTALSSLGLTVVPLNAALRRQFNIDEAVSGVVVTAVEPRSDAAAKGLETGHVITRVNNRAVRLPSDVSQAVAEAQRAGRDTALFLILDGRAERFVALRIREAQG